MNSLNGDGTVTSLTDRRELTSVAAVFLKLPD
jgi:hypothetical protein